MTNKAINAAEMLKNAVVIDTLQHDGIRDDDGLVSISPLAYVRDGKLYVVEMFKGEGRELLGDNYPKA